MEEQKTKPIAPVGAAGDDSVEEALPEPDIGVSLYDSGVLDVLLERENEINALLVRELEAPIPNDGRIRLLEMQLRIIHDGMLGAQIRAQMHAAHTSTRLTRVIALATVAYVLVAVVGVIVAIVK